MSPFDPSTPSPGDAATHPAGGPSSRQTQAEFVTTSGVLVTVSHNPISNLKLGAGIAPVPDYLRAGVALALGTDSMASNNSADLFEEVKTAALLPRGVHHDPAQVSGVDTLTMATSGGARALGGGLSGALAAGRAADLILVDTGGPTGTPMTNPVAFLSYAARGADVTDVFVAGRRLLADRVLTTLDEAAIRRDAEERVARIRAELVSGPS